jgi:hypothetical protein
VDLEGGKIRVRRNDWYGVEDTPKNGKSRDIPLNSMVRGALKAHRHQRSAYVFCELSDGAKFGHNTYVKPLWTTCIKVGLRKITWPRAKSPKSMKVANTTLRESKIRAL